MRTVFHRLKEHSGVIHLKEGQSAARRLPLVSILLLLGILILCGFAEFFSLADPHQLRPDLSYIAPGSQALLGTDKLGRDLFSMILYGGRLSLFIGAGAACISTLIALVFGMLSVYANTVFSYLLLRLAQMILSVPQLLLMLLIQACLGKPQPFSLIAVIALTSWVPLFYVVRSELMRLKAAEFVLSAQLFGANKLYLLVKHMVPMIISPLIFMIVMNMRAAILSEATLSFLGLGLDVETVSWGSLITLSQEALFTPAWWMVIIPGACLVGTLLCINNLAHYFDTKRM